MTKEKSSLEWFSVVEAEVNSRCNRRCGYCPVSINPAPVPQVAMTDEVFDRLISLLREIDYRGRFSFHLYNEPLLRKDLETLVSKVHSQLPEAFQLLYTNGDLLSNARYSSLRAAGIDHFLVTRHGRTPIPARENQTIQYPEDLILTNRGGMITLPIDRNLPLRTPCFAPSEMLIVTVVGDVLVCCNDAKRKNRMGNIMNQSLEEIWFSEEFLRIRRLLNEGNRANASSICAKCNDTEYFAKGENYMKDLQ